jgi:kynurenine formamidase
MRDRIKDIDLLKLAVETLEKQTSQSPSTKLVIKTIQDSINSTSSNKAENPEIVLFKEEQAREKASHEAIYSQEDMERLAIDQANELAEKQRQLFSDNIGTTNTSDQKSTNENNSTPSFLYTATKEHQTEERHHYAGIWGTEDIDRLDDAHKKELENIDKSPKYLP